MTTNWQKPGDPMRLIVMGQQAFGKDALAKILEAGKDEVVAVYCEPDREGRPVDPIKEFALEKGLAVHQPARFRHAAKRWTRWHPAMPT